MTERPTTLEEALAWLAEQHASLAMCGPTLWVETFRDELSGDIHIRNGDIPAAIVEAVGQVWDQVHGKGEA